MRNLELRLYGQRWRRCGCNMGHPLYSQPRSAIIRLVLAIARAGLSPFGQALVQFMIVWQR